MIFYSNLLKRLSFVQCMQRLRRLLYGLSANVLNIKMSLASAMLVVACSSCAADGDFAGANGGITPGAPMASTNVLRKAVVSPPEEANATVTTAAGTNGADNPMDLLDNSYSLAIGDSIDFQVLEDKEDPDDSGTPQTIVVTDSGDIEVPYIGRYPAEGKTCKELASQLKVELQKKYYYHATVIISVRSMASKGVIYIMGGVRSPGPLELPRDEVLTVSKAILRAGGFDDFADQKHVQVTRKAQSGTNTVFTVNVSAVLDHSHIDQDRQVKPGDLIYVSEKTFRY